jgi:hypothetical protein
MRYQQREIRSGGPENTIAPPIARRHFASGDVPLLAKTLLTE